MKAAFDKVRGAVAKKDLVPLLTCFHIYGGRIQGTNGRLVIDTPCQELDGLNVTVPMLQMMKTLEACPNEPTITVKDEKLLVKSGKLLIKIALGDHDTFPRQEPTIGKPVNTATLRAAVSVLAPFMGEDVSRPWACGINVRDNYAYATNNIILARTPIPMYDDVSTTFPDFVVDELLRLGNISELTDLWISDNTATIQYKDGTWIKTPLVAEPFPDVSQFFTASATTPIPEGLLKAVNTVLPFCPDPAIPLITFSPEGISTAEGDHSASLAGIVLPKGRYNATPLKIVLENATHAEFDHYPKVVPFKSDKIEGVLMGVQ